MGQGRRTDAAVRFITKLVSDCVTFNLTPDEALQYIKQESGYEIGYPAYYQYRSRLKSEKHTNAWLSYFTRIGFVQEHKQLLEDIKKVHQDRLKQFFLETQKEIRNERILSLLNHDILDNSRLISDLMDSTPIIAALKARTIKSDMADDGSGRIAALVSRVEKWKKDRPHNTIEGIGTETYLTQNSSQATVQEEQPKQENVEQDETGVLRPAGAAGESGERDRDADSPQSAGEETSKKPARRDLWTV